MNFFIFLVTFASNDFIGVQGYSDSARVCHRCDSGSIPTPCGYLIKIT